MANNKAKELLKRSLKVTPRATQTMSKGFQMWLLDEHFPIFIESGSGCLIKSFDGEEFIDTMGSLGPTILGHCDRDVDKAIKEQLKKGITYSLPSPLETELAELLCEVIPCCEMVRFCKNGSDAVSAAIRMCRAYMKKDYILRPKGSYSGWSDSVACATERNYGIPKMLAEFVKEFDYNDLEDLENKLKTGIYACVLMEPVSLEAPKEGYLRGVRDLCDKYDTILVFDEMITGFRWALGGAQEYHGAIPDLACFGKAVANGMPLSFVCGKSEYMNALEYVFFSATFFGEALSFAAGIATIKKMQKKGIFKHIWTQGNRVKRTFTKYCRDFGIDAEAIGEPPRLNFKFNYDDSIAVRDLFHKEMIKRGIFIGIQFYVTWATKKKHIDKVLEAMKESLEIVSHAVKEQKLDEYLGGQRSMVIFKRQ